MSLSTRCAVRGALVALASSAILAPAAPAYADEIQFGPHDIQTTFFINKSDDSNRVDYGLRLDAGCAPVNDDAVIAYWRVFEKSPPVRTQGLSLIDRIPYGIADQRTLSRSPTGGEYSLKLKQFTRPIIITTKREADGRCTSIARSSVNGSTAQLLSVFVKLVRFAVVDYIDVIGKNLETGAPISERIKK
jgi:hypothetical protein